MIFKLQRQRQRDISPKIDRKEHLEQESLKFKES